MSDHIKYSELVDNAMYQVVRQALKIASTQGLPGNHRFLISFLTTVHGVKLPSKIQEKYTDEMTIVLQHQFYNLSVKEEYFSVQLSFGRKLELIVVPFKAIIYFADPSVNFILQFQCHDEKVAGENLDNTKIINTPPQGNKAKILSLEKFREQKNSQ